MGLITVVFLSVFIVFSDSARILAVFPTPSISHQIVFRPFTLELANRGHEVVVITTDPMFAKDQTPVNFTEIDVHDISYSMWEDLVLAGSRKTLSYHEYTKYIVDLFTNITLKQYETPQVQSILEDKEQMFDLIIIEACVRAALFWSHLYKVPVIQISSFGSFPGIFEDVGNPIHPDFYPVQLRQKINNLTVWDRIMEDYSYYKSIKIFESQRESAHKQLMKIFGPNFPSLNELNRNIDMTFINIRPLWDFNRPTAPNLIYLGGLHTNNKSDLHEELKSYVDSSKNGVIYISFGTNVKPSYFPPHVLKIILNVLATLPYDVLWKWDKDELNGRPKNVKISKWYPQFDLLQHPKIKLFITQGGLQSTDEAINAGVPLVGIPILGDQYYNTEMYVRHKIGVKLDIKTMSEKDFRNAINIVLRDESYRVNIIKLRTLMHDESQTSLERVIFWTEHVLRHGGAKHLRAPAANMSWTEYYELELVCIVLAFFVLVIIILVSLINAAIKSLSTDLSNIKCKMY